MTPQRPRSSSLRVAALALWLATAAGCGPGVGGTGTGGAMAPQPAVTVTAAPLCGADFAALLDCAPPSSGMPASQGTAAVSLADAEPQSLVTALLEGNAATLAAACQRLSFKGDWGVSSALGARFYGNVTLDGAALPATLFVQAASGRLEMRLFDSQQRLLLGPVSLGRVSVPTTPAPCP